MINGLITHHSKHFILLVTFILSHKHSYSIKHSPGDRDKKRRLQEYIKYTGGGGYSLSLNYKELINLYLINV